MKLYVGNLPYSVDDAQLNELFASFGEVSSATVLTDKISGRSRGYGFVEFADDAAGQAALAEMNGKEIDGRALKVDEAKPMQDRGNDRGNRY